MADHSPALLPRRHRARRPHPAGATLALACAMLAAAASTSQCTAQPSTPSLPGTEWLLEDIQSRGVPDNLNSPLAFAADGSFHGNAGCNIVRGKAVITADRIEFPTILTSRKACIGAAMEHETAYLEALGKVRRWHMDARGLLHLGDEAGRDLLRYAPR
jgi:heat shock protein HslJ